MAAPDRVPQKRKQPVIGLFRVEEKHPKIAINLAIFNHFWIFFFFFFFPVSRFCRVLGWLIQTFLKFAGHW